MIAVIAIFTVLLSTANYAYGKHLTELPNYLVPCNVSDKPCLTRTLQNIFLQLKTGIPGITNVTNIDLQESDKIQVILNQTDLIDVQVTLSKGIVLGLSDTEVQNPFYYEKRGTISFEMKFPKLRMMADYEMEGKILKYDVTGKNKFIMNLENSDAQVKMLTDLVTQDGEQFFLVQDVKIKFGKIRRIQTFFKDLFKSNKSIEKEAEEEFKKHVRDLNRAILPLVEESVRDILKTIMRRVFRFIPVKYVFANISHPSLEN
ncbi:unnamed protein product [Hermetia illucens]|uniref:Uncharacterized protein n=1 Tax=Hermetia illucens TaxID=343691 RepID=A0A7R8UBV1_HERIL|nr:uncharacterized protein LOC119646856 [Hermetia illucens]CAD7077905.1 unnamed protein product [Hermetia illucens]